MSTLSPKKPVFTSQDDVYGRDIKSKLRFIIHHASHELLKSSIKASAENVNLQNEDVPVVAACNFNVLHAQVTVDNTFNIHRVWRLHRNINHVCNGHFSTAIMSKVECANT